MRLVPTLDLCLLVTAMPDWRCITEETLRTLPKNGESHRHSVGFCRLSRNDILLFSAPLVANRRAFNQLGSFPWRIHRWHAVCSLTLNLQDWLPGVAGTDPRLGYRFGASITKRGLAPAPFFISGITPGPIHSATPSDSERSKRPEGLILVASPHIDCVQRNLSPS